MSEIGTVDLGTPESRHNDSRSSLNRSKPPRSRLTIKENSSDAKFRQSQSSNRNNDDIEGLIVLDHEADERNDTQPKSQLLQVTSAVTDLMNLDSQRQSATHT